MFCFPHPIEEWTGLLKDKNIFFSKLPRNLIFVGVLRQYKNASLAHLHGMPHRHERQNANLYLVPSNQYQWVPSFSAPIQKKCPKP